MGEVRIKVDEIIGETEDVIRLFKEGGLNLSQIVKTKKEIKVPNWSLCVFHLLFVILLISGLCVSNEKISIALSLLALGVAFLNIALVYAKWEKVPLLIIAAAAHFALIGVAYGIYSIGDILEQAEDAIKYMK